MRKIIAVLFLSLVFFQLSDLLAFRFIGNANVNSHGPYSVKIPEILMTVAVITSLLILSYLLVKARHKLPLAIIIGAGISNLLDRIIYGGVVDYIKFFNISTINLADIAITSSIVTLIYLMVKDHSETISAKPGV